MVKCLTSGTKITKRDMERVCNDRCAEVFVFFNAMGSNANESVSAIQPVFQVVSVYSGVRKYLEKCRFDRV